jgi:hypothetical protein
VRNFSDADLQDLIAYLRSQQAVTTPVNGGDRLNFLMTLVVGSGLVPEASPVKGSVVVPLEGPTAEYGKYIVSFQGCDGCHGADLSGSSSFGPPAPSLRVVKGWTQEGFINTIRNGVDPAGHQLSDAMPWKTFAKMDDTDLAAVYAYLHSPP